MTCIGNDDVPSAFGAGTVSRVVAEGPFFRLIVIERAARSFACRRLTARGRGDAIAISHVRGEAEILAALAGRGAPALEIAGDDDAGPFTVYEWINGQLLAEYTQKVVVPAELARVARACFASLAAIHDATDVEDEHALGVVHGDVRPENIVIADGPSEPRAAFVDFGLARSKAHSPASDGAFAGSIQYAAPEAARGEPSGQAEDVFALAMCILHAITKVPPRTSTTFTALLSEAAEIAPQLPEGSAHGALVDAIRACFSMDPALRPRAAEVARALDLFA